MDKDGGGIRGYSSLLVLQALMKEIVEVEKALEPTITSSAQAALVRSRRVDPIQPGTPDAEKVTEVVNNDRFLPCHYFDFIAGASTGG